jgi:hypothetical protein
MIRIEGNRKRRILALATWLVTATLVCLPGIWLVINDQTQAAADEAAFWSLTGPPCPPLAKDRFHRSSRPPHRTVFDGVLFERRAGHMMCTRRPYPHRATDERFPTCRFTSPDYLGVVAGGQERYYDLTGGRSARVGVLDGHIRCVLTSRFRM